MQTRVEANTRSLTHLKMIDLLPTHCLNTNNELEGFRATYGGQTMASVLPLNHTMFHGHSIFQCISEDTSFNNDVYKLSSDFDKTRGLMSGFLEVVNRASRNSEATFQCMPEYNEDTEFASFDVSKKNKLKDCKEWMPELPTQIGIYHTFLRGYHHRRHKMFICVSGGLQKCGTEYYNLISDMGHCTPCMDVVKCQETWWLRKANQRARARLASLVAKMFDLKIEEVHDIHEFNDKKMAVFLNDTIEFDIKSTGTADNSDVDFYSACVDTTSIQNGIACNMHPTEGVWVFCGDQRNSLKSISFGGMFGTRKKSGVFPSRSPCYHVGNGHQYVQHAPDSDFIVRNSVPAPPKTGSQKSVYQCFGENVIKKFESELDWKRDNKIVELIPIIVGME
jgi:hypothetical protein